MKKSLLFLTIIFLSACSGGGGGSSSSTPSAPPDVSNLAEYAKLWKFVNNGDFHSTMEFNASGITISNSVNSFYGGSLVKTGNLTCHISEHFTAIVPGEIIYQEVFFEYDGIISADRTTMYGTFTWVALEVPSWGVPAYSGGGNWCATEAGIPYLTNDDFNGTWDVVNDIGGAEIQFDGNGNIIPNAYVESGTLRLLGADKFAIEYFDHGFNMNMNWVNIRTRMIGTLDTDMSGTYVNNYGTYEHDGYFFGALMPSGSG